MSLHSSFSPLLMVILDGWGVAKPSPGNAVTSAKPLCWEQHWGIGQDFIKNDTKLRRTLLARGPAVGLPEGQMGNSEVGHLTIGSGRVIHQDLQRINLSFLNNQFEQMPAWQKFTTLADKGSKRVHCLAMVSDGGVHAHLSHLIDVIKHLLNAGLKPILHLVTDGRDTLPTQAARFLRLMLKQLGNSADKVEIASICGRFFAFDRDQNWERVEKAYRAIVEGSSEQSFLGNLKAAEYIESRYALDESEGDEFIEPACNNSYQGFQDRDSFIMLSFRADRARQITQAITDPDFSKFARSFSKLAASALFGDYYASAAKHSQILFPRPKIIDTLGEVVAKLGLKQFRIAETEKYAHVTYFFSGGREQEFDGETRKLIPSPKVKTYDLKPEMSSSEVGDALVKAIEAEQAHFYLVNFANPDMVGHCGKMDAAMAAVRSVDKQLARLIKICREKNINLLVTADHGNCDEMINPDGKPMTAHSLNPVPLIISPKVVGDQKHDFILNQPQNNTFGLSSLAPTALTLMGIDVPEAMTAPSLITKANK